MEPSSQTRAWPSLVLILRNLCLSLNENICNPSYPKTKMNIWNCENYFGYYEKLHSLNFNFVKYCRSKFEARWWDLFHHVLHFDCERQSRFATSIQRNKSGTFLTGTPIWYQQISYMDHVANATVRLRAGSSPQLSQLIQRSRLRLFGHVARMDASLDISRALKTSIWGLPIEWKRPPRRPRHMWLRTLEADLQPHNLGLNSTWKYAQGREYWKHLMETATLQLGACAW